MTKLTLLAHCRNNFDLSSCFLASLFLNAKSSVLVVHLVSMKCA